MKRILLFILLLAILVSCTNQTKIKQPEVPTKIPVEMCTGKGVNEIASYVKLSTDIINEVIESLKNNKPDILSSIADRMHTIVSKASDVSVEKCSLPLKSYMIDMLSNGEELIRAIAIGDNADVQFHSNEVQRLLALALAEIDKLESMRNNVMV